MDYFVSYSMAQKLALLQGISESIMTGQVVRVQTAPGVFTEFNPSVSNELTYQRLCDSVANDPGFDANDPLQAACRDNARPGITRARYC